VRPKASFRRPTSTATDGSSAGGAQRAYEMNGKVITAADQMLQADANLIR
jgi:flagellar basal body rod protein FlgC